MRINNEKRIKKHIAWGQFGDRVEKLTWKIKNSRFRFDGVYGIPKNGSVIASIIAKKLNLELLTKVKSDNTLIVDDISDSGNTLDKFKEVYPANIIATIHFRVGTKVMPDITVSDAGVFWIVYPWEDD